MGSLNFVGGEKGGVGKTVMARVLAQYCIDREHAFRCFDTDRSHRSLSRFYSAYTEPMVVDSFENLDIIAETVVEDPQQKLIVDLAAQTFQPVADWVLESGAIETFSELDIRLNFWHVMDDGRDSMDLLARLIDVYGENANYVVVLNQGRGEDFSDLHRSPAYRQAVEYRARIIVLPRLHASTMHKIDLNDTSFWAACHNEGEPEQNLRLMERQRVKGWLAKVYPALESLYW